MGYLVCSRYDTVWHLMNVAVDDRLLRQGIATTLLERLFELADKPNEQYTLEVRTSNDAAIRLYERFDFRAAGAPPRLLPRQPRGRAHHVAHGAGPRHGVILGLETSCDDTCAAVVDHGGAIRSNVIASQGLLHARYGGVVPEIASRHHLELVDAVTADALERAGARLDDVETVAVTTGPGLIGALLVGVSSAKALAASRRLPLVPVDHLHGHVTASMLGGDADRAALPVPRGERRPHLPRARGRPGRLRGARADARRRRRRGLRQGRPAARASATRAGRRSTGWRARAIPEAFDFPRSAPGELDFSFSGLKTSLLYRLRELTDADRSPTSRPPTSARSSTRSWPAPRRRSSASGLERLAIGGGVAANSELRAAVGALGVPVWVPPVELCTDNAAMIAGAARFKEPLPYPDYLSLDAAARVSCISRDSSRSSSRSTRRRTSSLISPRLRMPISSSRWASNSSYISRWYAPVRSS